MITIIKNYRNKETLRLAALQEVADNIRTSTYDKEVEKLRYVYPLAKINKHEDGTLMTWYEQTKNLPRLCFALEMENRRGKRVAKSYTGLVLLEVDNLTSNDEAKAIRQGAAEMPQTLMAFVGADGRSVKIVCRGEEVQPSAKGGKAQPQEGSLPKTKERIAAFHENLYERARLIYNGQLGVTVEKLEPMLERICYMSCDPEMVFNPLATPILARAERPTKDLLHQQRTYDNSDYRDYMSLSTAYEFCLSKAYDETVGISDDEERIHAVLTLLAKYCQEADIPMLLAQRQAMLSLSLGSDKLLVRKVFENAYQRKNMQKSMEQKGIARYRHVPSETLLTLKINVFLNENYELRKNVMRGVAEYRQRTGIGFMFQDLTEEARNSITMRALEQGIRCWDKDIRRYVNSEDITLYDPVGDYLEHLPQWDEQDRVEVLAKRVPTAYKEWPELFHIWMRSMVAMWLGKGQLTGNALTPLLIGRQGCGKSSFCRILLPRDLQDYYNDRINFKNEQDLNLGLTSFALINLDEFDKITQRQQIVLKYLLSTADLKYRPPYGKAYQSHRRYASFIGTTNEQTPLTDPTGSRRFICVGIDGNIDFQTPVEHAQLYAQLVTEIQNGERYWLTKEEEQALMRHNQHYQKLNGLGEMLMAAVQKPQTVEEGQWMTLPELAALLNKTFGGFKQDAATLQKIGNFLNRPEYKFESKRLTKGMIYLVKIL